MSVAGLVLAGGRGSRLGADKAMAELGGLSLAQRSAGRLRPQVAALAISANGDPRRFGPGSPPVLADVVPGFRGPLAGILSGLIWATAQGPCRWMATVAVDTPFFPADLVARLLAAAAPHPELIAVARSRGRLHPVFALWPLGCLPALDAALRREDGGKVMAFIDGQGYVPVDFDDEASGIDPFFNINTPEDLAEARKLLNRPAP
ncbi:MAG: molybdenum cofactor guanylyltransferase MobA [Rhizobiaceae bacterium]|nr:molybdenum cofactor guanylyltransferase MobA [Rhizobiaceae bacterium]